MEQRSDEWFAARLGKVTASRISDVMMKPTTKGYRKYLAQLILEREIAYRKDHYTSGAMMHGTETEPQARAMYELETGLMVEETGFIPHPEIDGSGASPDGLVGAEGLVEIKCPEPEGHMDNILNGATDKDYLRQMQWQMECTGRTWCDFVSFSPEFPMEMQIYIERVEFDPAIAKEIRTAVVGFLADADKTLNRIKQITAAKDAA